MISFLLVHALYLGHQIGSLLCQSMQSCVCTYVCAVCCVLCVWGGGRGGRGCFSVLLFMILSDLDGDNGYLEAKRTNREVMVEAFFSRPDSSSLYGDFSSLIHIPPAF